jgi:IS5 family transposase
MSVKTPENIEAMVEPLTFSVEGHPIFCKNCSDKQQDIGEKDQTMAYKKQEQYDIYFCLFQEPLQRNHELILLAERIDWDDITDRLLPYYSKKGRRAKKIRLMTGLHILKHRFSLSDEDVVKGLHENVYWMAFCGVKLQAGYTSDGRGEVIVRPCSFLEPSTMTKFRRRLGAEGLRALEDSIKGILISEKQICPRTQVVDTTAQPKHIGYPTDTALLDRGRRRLVRTIKSLSGQGVKAGRGLRTFARLSKKVIVELNKLGKDRTQRIETGLRKLSEYAQEVIKRVPRVVEEAQRKVKQLSKRGKQKQAHVIEQLKERLQGDTELLNRVIHQAQERLRGVHVPGKIYSLHEPHVACIRKGKRAKPNEYGTKVLISVDRHGYVVDHKEYASNPQDSELLDEACQRWEQVFRAPAKELAADRGFHVNPRSKSRHLKKIPKVSIPTTGKKPHPAAKTFWFKRLQKQRAKIEPLIGHLKVDYGMERCRYKGFEGDQINVSLASIAWNLRKWGKHLTAQAA